MANGEWQMANGKWALGVIAPPSAATTRRKKPTRLVVPGNRWSDCPLDRIQNHVPAHPPGHHGHASTRMCTHDRAVLGITEILRQSRWTLIAEEKVHPYRSQVSLISSGFQLYIFIIFNFRPYCSWEWA
jgi:hypothetical protein